MPHLAGIFDLNTAPGDPAPVLRRMATVLSVEGVEYLPCAWSDERFGAINLIGSDSAEPDQPLVSVDGNIVLFLDGMIYNGADLRTADKGTSGSEIGRSVCRLCLELYRRHGDRFVEKLNGEFNLLVYDKLARQVKVFNDRLAYRPLYYSHARGRTFFALERKAILAGWNANPKVDYQSVLELFAFGHHLEDRTFFDGILAMPQASVLTISQDGTTVRQYWSPSYGRGDSPLSLDDYSHEFAWRMTQATSSRLPNGRRTAIFLSGGLDSRCVAGALSRSTRDVTAITFGNQDSPDVRYARAVAGQLGFRHLRLLPANKAYADALPRAVWRTEAAVPFHQVTSIENHRYIRPHAQTIFNGHLGDALTGGHMLPHLLLVRSPDELAEHILAKRSYLRLSDLRRVFRAAFLDRAFDEMRGSLLRRLVAIPEDRLPLAYNIWDVTVRQRRFTFCSPAIDRYLFEQITPFVDTRVLDWSLRIPLRFLVGQRAYKRAIVHGFPEISRVPWARTGRRIPTSLTSDLLLQGGQFARRRVARRFRAGSAVPRSVLTDPRLRMRLDQYLSSDEFPHQVFDAERVRGVVSLHFEGREDSTMLISDLLTVAEATRLFVAHGVNAPPPEVQPGLDPAPSEMVSV